MSDFCRVSDCGFDVILKVPKYVERIARPMKDICQEAETNKDKVWVLYRLRAEILLDHDQFLKSHFDFMNEYIQGFIDEYDKENTVTGTYYSDGL